VKSTQVSNRFSGITTCIAVFLAASGLASTAPAQQKPDGTRERIGVYDSRAIAVAYVGSTYQQAKLKELEAQLAKAKEAGNTKEVARLETEGKAWQKKLNQQGFGKAPVDDLLVPIAAELPRIQEAAKVTSLVSKWDQARLSKDATFDQIDVTILLVDAFHPNELQRKRAMEIQKLKPVLVKE
jgi:hypothetical protein